MTVPYEINSNAFKLKLIPFSIVLLAFTAIMLTTVKAGEYTKPWKNKNKAIIIDAYEKNEIDWLKLVENKQIRAFIGKASDGLQSPYSCSGNTTEKLICKKTFSNYWMKQQLYHTRKVLAKSLGLKWGAYHLGRPGNPIEQANHFITFADPQPDELIALDIEHDNPKKWISLKDAELFARHIKRRLGRYPVLYTNHNTAERIAARRDELPILSRLPLWYARYKSNTEGTFPLGNWESFNMWQFSSGVNCNKSRCLYRVKGAPNNIDVNVSDLTIAEFDKAWPFNSLVDERGVEPNVEEPTVWVKNETEETQSGFQLASVGETGREEKKPVDVTTTTSSVVTATSSVMAKAKLWPAHLLPEARRDLLN